MSGRTKKPQFPEGPIPEATNLKRRLVIEHTAGPLAGLLRIVGICEGQIPSVLPGPLSVAGETHLVQSAILVKSHKLYVIYREQAEEGSK